MMQTRYFASRYSSAPRCDVDEIRSLIGNRYDSLDRASGRDCDWRGFEDGLLCIA